MKRAGVYLWTKQGWKFLAVVMDLYSRKIIGWGLKDFIQSSDIQRLTFLREMEYLT